MIWFILTSIIVFLIITLFGHVIHWMLHQRFSGRFNKAHMTHHLKLYPKHNYKSDIYRSPGKDSTVKTFILAAVPLLISPILLHVFIKISLLLTIWIVIEMITLGILFDRIHDSFHLNKSMWQNLPGYKSWEKLHFIHHRNMKRNYGIFSFHWDRLFGTLKIK